MSHDQHPFRIFRPAEAPSWLPQVLSSIEGLFRRVLPTWIRLHDIETTELPPASIENRAGLAYDKTDDRLTYSNSTAWVQLQDYDADLAAIAALADPNADRILFWDDSAGSYAYLTANTGLSISGTNLNVTNTQYTDEMAQDAVGGILTDTATIDFTYNDGAPSITADVKDGSITFAKMQDIATDKVLGRTTASTGDIEELSTTGTGNVMMSASPTTSGTLTGAAANFSGNFGIGNNAATPASRLQLYRNALYSDLLGQLICSDSSNEAERLTLGYDATNNVGFIQAYENGVGYKPLSLQPNSANVGIGEIAPDYKLDVNGTFGFTPGTSVTPVDNGDVVIEFTNNTTLTFKGKGSDGTIRTATLTLA